MPSSSGMTFTETDLVNFGAGTCESSHFGPIVKSFNYNS